MGADDAYRMNESQGEFSAACLMTDPAWRWVSRGLFIKFIGLALAGVVVILLSVGAPV